MKGGEDNDNYISIIYIAYSINPYSCHYKWQYNDFT